MPRIDLTDDEYDTILSLREREDKPRGYCEDYPCCGHTSEDPCTRQWYDTAAGKDYIWRHACCDHDAGWCEIYDYESEED